MKESQNWNELFNWSLTTQGKGKRKPITEIESWNNFIIVPWWLWLENNKVVKVGLLLLEQFE